MTAPAEVGLDGSLTVRCSPAIGVSRVIGKVADLDLDLDLKADPSKHAGC